MLTVRALHDETPPLVSCAATSAGKPAPFDARFVTPVGAISTLSAVRCPATPTTHGVVPLSASAGYVVMVPVLLPAVAVAPMGAVGSAPRYTTAAIRIAFVHVPLVSELDVATL